MLFRDGFYDERDVLLGVVVMINVMVLLEMVVMVNPMFC